MATLPAFLRKPETTTPRRNIAAPAPGRPDTDPYALRALPLEDVFFHCKRIDNSRLRREPDLRSRGACWTALGAASVLVAMLGSVLVPGVLCTVAGYRLQELRAEERQLIGERQVLAADEAALLSPERLHLLAKDHSLEPPAPGQVVHVEGKGAVAMAK